MTTDLIEILQNKIDTDIPLTQHMGVKVVRYSGQHLTLSAPLENNINHRQTAFGGSITSLATLCCWGLIYLELYQLKIAARIVIQDGATDYLAVIEDDFTAECRITQESQFLQFLKTLERKGMARIALQSQVRAKGEVGAVFKGHFVAKKY